MPTAREWSGSRQNVWQHLDPVNVVLVEPICEGFGRSVKTFGTGMAGVVFVVSEDCDLMYGSEVWASRRVRTPSMLGDLQSGDAQTFSLSLGGWHDGISRLFVHRHGICVDEASACQTTRKSVSMRTWRIAQAAKLVVRACDPELTAMYVDCPLGEFAIESDIMDQPCPPR